MARQRLGQHFLSDAHWRERIADAIHLGRPPSRDGVAGGTEEFCWLEIGAGHGEMTELLVRSGARVYALELDQPLIERLNKLARKHPNLTIVPGDVLQADLRVITGGVRMRIYGNLPYYITSPILHQFFTFADLIDEIHVVIQEEVAERLTSTPGNKAYGYLSVAAQFYTRPELVFQIPSLAFQPPPEVDSALVSMRLPGDNTKLGLADGESFLEFVKTCFAQKRKTLINNFRAFLKPEQTRTALHVLNIREDARAEQLSVAQLAALYKTISSVRSADDPDNRT
jgi:16S rRNA (adenine1518-N6/adenine1519-N6)-dimethyltransferase